MRRRYWCGVLMVAVGWPSFLLPALGAVLLATFGAPAVVMAQEEDEAGDEATGQDAATSSTAAGDSRSARESKSYLSWFFEALGWGYSIVFLSLSFTLVALIVMNLLTARRDNVVPLDLVEAFEEHLNEDRFQEAYEMARSDESFLGLVLSAGLAKVSTGYSQAIEAMQEVGEEENMKLEHRLSYLALIGTISPMIGLFGTVDGMIRSFSVLAFAEATPKVAELAQGISTAMFTTLVGLAIAIPAIAAFNILRNRIARLVLEVGILSEGLMNRFQK